LFVLAQVDPLPFALGASIELPEVPYGEDLVGVVVLCATAAPDAPVVFDGISRPFDRATGTLARV
jgi:hypothetical protein